jgi:hypothetical protein
MLGEDFTDHLTTSAVYSAVNTGSTGIILSGITRTCRYNTHHIHALMMETVSKTLDANPIFA